MKWTNAKALPAFWCSLGGWFLIYGHLQPQISKVWRLKFIALLAAWIFYTAKNGSGVGSGLFSIHLYESKGWQKCCFYTRKWSNDKWWWTVWVIFRGHADVSRVLQLKWFAHMVLDTNDPTIQVANQNKRSSLPVYRAACICHQWWVMAFLKKMKRTENSHCWGKEIKMSHLMW